jgi:hypothetical protein
MNAIETLIVQALREAASYSRVEIRKREYLLTARNIAEGKVVCALSSDHEGRSQSPVGGVRDGDTPIGR